MAIRERHLPLIGREFTFMSCGNITLHTDQRFTTVSTGPGYLRSRIKLTVFQNTDFYLIVSATHRLSLNKLDSSSIDLNSIVAFFGQYCLCVSIIVLKRQICKKFELTVRGWFQYCY